MRDLAPVDLINQRAGRLWPHTGRLSRPLAQLNWIATTNAPSLPVLLVLWKAGGLLMPAV